MLMNNKESSITNNIHLKQNSHQFIYVISPMTGLGSLCSLSDDEYL